MKKSLLIRLLAALILLLPSSLFAKSGDEVDGLLDAHIEALGGAANIQSIMTVITSSDVRIGGMKGSMKSWSMKPCLSRTEISLGILNIEQVFDVDRSWMRGPNGKVQIQRDESTGMSGVTSCLLNDFSYLSRPDGVEYRMAADDTASGASCRVMEIVPAGGVAARLYFQGSSFLVEKIVIEDPSGTVEQWLSDYRPAGGVMFPFKTVIRQKATGQTVVMTASSVEVNEVLDPAIFLPPGDGLKDYAFRGAEPSEKVPFRYTGQHIYLPVSLQGASEELDFILDSGAGMTVIDSTVAAQMGLAGRGSIPGAGAGGMTDFKIVTIDGFSVGGIDFTSQTVITYPLSNLLEGVPGIRIGGILGYDFLSRFVSEIDYANGAATFFEPDSFTAPQGAVVLDAPLMHNIFSFRGRLDGAHEGTFLLDTGASLSIIQKGFADGRRLLEGRRTAEALMAGAGGSGKTLLCRFDSIEFAGIVHESPVFAIPERSSGIGSFADISGIVGNDILQRFTVYLDYRRQECLLLKNSLFGKPFFPDRCGAELRCGPGGRIVVGLVIPGTPASEAGIGMGDVITAIDGSEAPGCDSIDEVRELFMGEEGKRIDLLLERSGEKTGATIVLRAYI